MFYYYHVGLCPDSVQNTVPEQLCCTEFPSETCLFQTWSDHLVQSNLHKCTGPVSEHSLGCNHILLVNSLYIPICWIMTYIILLPVYLRNVQRPLMRPRNANGRWWREDDGRKYVYLAYPGTGDVLAYTWTCDVIYTKGNNPDSLGKTYRSGYIHCTVHISATDIYTVQCIYPIWRSIGYIHCTVYVSVPVWNGYIHL
jgi:hypothetical protein